MAVTIADTRTVPSEADSTTGWSSPVKGEALTLFTSDPNPVESTGCIGMAVSIETSDIVYTISSTDLTSTLVYVWTLANGTMDTIANGGVALVLGDATNLVGYHMAGSDAAAFRHASGPVGWQCLVVNTSNLPSSKTQLQGSVDPTITTITRIGAMYKTLSKALGGSSNCFTDVIRYGNGGLTITAGTSGDTGKFSEIATDDRSSTSGKAYGIVRELGTGLYGVQGPLTFGDTAGTAPTYFADTNTTVVFESRNLGASKYSITVQGNATGSTTFQLGTQIGSSTSGANGCSLICPSGVGASFTATDADLQFVLLYGSTISGFNNGVSFSANATNGPNHKIYDCTFTGCGQIDPGKTQFKNNSISSTTDANGGLLIDADGTSNISDLSFTSDGTGHAIYITAAGTYTFNNFTYTGYGATGTTDAVIYNNSGGAVTINVSGGDTPTYRNGSGATTTVVTSASLVINIVDSDGNTITQNCEVTVVRNSDTTILFEEDNIIDGTTTYSYSSGGGTVTYVNVLNVAGYQPKTVNNVTLPSSGSTTLTVQLDDDPFYSNP